MSDHGIARFKLKIAGAELEASASLPTEPTRTSEMLPVFRSLTDTIVNMSVEAVKDQGLSISCKAGCGACCRQMVPVSEHEARSLAALVDSLPEERQAVIRERFHQGLLKLKEAGVIDDMMRLAEIKRAGDRSELGLKYFHAGVPCPFLENESCGIYEDRPLRCREYLVTSPPEHCAHPTANSVKGVILPVIPSVALFQFGNGDGKQRRVVLPLIAALAWVAIQEEEKLPHATPQEVLLNFLKGLKKN